MSIFTQTKGWGISIWISPMAIPFNFHGENWHENLVNFHLNSNNHPTLINTYLWW